MVVEWVPSHTMNIVGALVLTAFAVGVATVPPRTRVQLGFGIFAGAFGITTAFANLLLMSDSGDLWVGATPAVAATTALAAVAGLLLLWCYMPVPLAPAERWLLLPALITAAPFVAAAVYGAVHLEEFVGFSGLAAPIIAISPLHNGFWFGLLVLLVLRYMRPGAHPDVRLQAPILSAGLVLYLGVNARWSGPIHAPAMRIAGTLTLIGVLVLAVLWLAAAARGPDPRTCRNVAWLTLATALAGFLYDALGWTQTTIGIDGIARIATVAFVSVAILRHQALGIHGTLRFGISKSTVAAVFIAVFFIVSEAAQALFSGFVGNDILGILAAGALVFAIAPLQRVADRLAERAVPRQDAVASGGAEASFRQAVRWTLRDSSLSREEERALFLLAGDLGLSPRRALELREEEEQAVLRGEEAGAPAD